jgi:hypothetical protein
MGWVVQVYRLGLDLENITQVNRYEYLNAWRNIAATGGWFVEDLPPELSELKAIFQAAIDARLASNAVRECMELYAAWEQSNVHNNQLERSKAMGRQLSRMIEEVKT